MALESRVGAVILRNLRNRSSHRIDYAPNLGTIAPMLGTTESADKLASVLFGKAQQVVLGLLFGRPDESFYVREIVRATRVGQGAVQRELQRLAETGSLIA
jgi:uncharacterized protein